MSPRVRTPSPAKRRVRDEMRIFVVDTNVLLHDPMAIYKFAEHQVVIPLVVVEELDSFKRGQQELAHNARMVLRLMDRERQKGSLLKGVALDSGGTLRVEMSGIDPLSHNHTKADNLILQTARHVAEHSPLEVTLVTKDMNLRIKADAVGMRAEDYLNDRVQMDNFYTGQGELTLPPEMREMVSRGEALPPEATRDLLTHQFVLLKNMASSSHTVLVRYRGGGQFSAVKRPEPLWGIKPRNKEQQCALDLLLDDNIMLVTLVGKAGTGKTLLALAAGLQRAVDERVFTKLVVSRPVLPMGRDLGYLPGEVDDKLKPWMQPIYDNLELLVSNREKPGHRKGGNGVQELLFQNLVQVEPLTYIRGRSLPSQYMIVDESQNLTPHEIKTIITRAGDGTKIVLTGDPHQIDNPYVDANTNGLSYVVDHFKGQNLYGHVTLSRGERSRLAELASNLL